jgi:REP element-mobilizing transposase RayT
MSYNPDIHHRRSIRLKNYDYSSAGTYFITINAYKRDLIFGVITNGEMVLNEFGRIAESFFCEIENRYPNVLLDEFIVMPDHVHVIINVSSCIDCSEEGFASTQSESDRSMRRKMTIPKIVGFYKMNVAKKINLIRHMSGMSLWQRNYYERVIRSDYELDRVRDYVRNNPRNWKERESDSPLL